MTPKVIKEPKTEIDKITIEVMQFTWPPTKDFLNFVGNSMRNFVKDQDNPAEAELLYKEDELFIARTITEGDFIIKNKQGLRVCNVLTHNKLNMIYEG
jgi:hypothetical protein